MASVRLSEDELEDVYAVAERKGIAASTVIREALVRAGVVKARARGGMR